MGEATAKNIDRLVTVQLGFGGPVRRSIIAPLYECACKKLDGKGVFKRFILPALPPFFAALQSRIYALYY